MSKLLISIISYLALLLLALVPEWQTSKAEDLFKFSQLRGRGVYMSTLYEDFSYKLRIRQKFEFRPDIAT